MTLPQIPKTKKILTSALPDNLAAYLAINLCSSSITPPCDACPGNKTGDVGQSADDVACCLLMVVGVVSRFTISSLDSDYVRTAGHGSRKKRVIKKVIGPNDVTININFGERFEMPIIQKIFKVDMLEKIEDFDTNPIKHPQILTEMKTFGVTREQAFFHSSWTGLHTILSDPGCGDKDF
ncbi:hypothetical protein B9Z55_000923 [Caenorhabditis nigoni]|uniref:Uncharacterized protein n=1 Tax=Caenorhabditis nigoni TaxID=1611254 RepID=A0A2G5VVV2_9PELO|nr:hypothetical protein B9Z55_000923 [Caenorhabditis nigoni]